MHKILFYNKFIICLYMFRAQYAHHQEVKVVLYSIWCHHTYRWPSRALLALTGLTRREYFGFEPRGLLKICSFIHYPKSLAELSWL